MGDWKAIDGAYVNSDGTEVNTSAFAEVKQEGTALTYGRDADWGPGWSQWQAARAKEIDMALRGQRSVEASLAAADVAVNLVLKTYKGNKR